MHILPMYVCKWFKTISLINLCKFILSCFLKIQIIRQIKFYITCLFCNVADSHLLFYLIFNEILGLFFAISFCDLCVLFIQYFS